MTVAAKRGLGFIVGFGFALLPNLAPFVAILAAFSQEWRFRRTDAYWLLGAVLLAAPLTLAGQLGTAAAGLAEVLAAWLLFRTFGSISRSVTVRLDPSLIAVGMVAGLATVMAAGTLGIERIQPLAHLSQAVVWESPPNLFAHSVLALGLLIAALVPRAPYRTLALALAAIGILLAGSRDAAIAWTVASLPFVLLAPSKKRSVRTVEIVLLVGMVAVSAGLSSTFGFARLGFLLQPAPASHSTNLLHGTELARGDWWFDQGVSVRAAPTTIGGRSLTAYTVAKVKPEAWRRLQQGVDLNPGAAYTLSAWIRSSAPKAIPGLEGWGENRRVGGTLVVVGGLRRGHWRSHIVGDGTLLGAGLKSGGDGWTRVWTTFRYSGTRPMHWWVGFTPDQRDVTGSTGTMAGLQLERGARLTSYEPGAATQGLSLSVARLPYWSAAWHSFLQRPWLGRPATPFDQYYAGSASSMRRYYEVPTHAHDLVLQVLYQRGLVGLLGLLLVIYGLSRNALRQRDVLFFIALGGILLANVFDYTFFFGGVIYPLAAVAGWRSTMVRAQRGHADQRARAALVRLTLAVFDVLAAVLALGLALWIRNGLSGAFGLGPLRDPLPNGVLYALLIWPVLSWREGLYPGYGTTAAQELRRGVLASFQAGLLLTAGSVLFSRSLPVPRSLLLLTALFAIVTIPVGRAIAKRLLLHLGAWGRDVVVLGAGSTGQRVARGLRRASLSGLNPVAFFDDDPAKQNRRFEALPVVGPLDAVETYAQENGIVHAIVAMPGVEPAALASVVERSTSTFRRVQFVPELPGIPTEDVYASELDEMLALEIRGGLYATGNRVAKRAIDLVGGTFLTLLVSPVLLALYLWVRLDTRGPGFHRSERLGEHGDGFRCFKFRTMHADAEERLGELLASDPALAAEYATFHKLQNDPRITRAGRFLRKTSLDELPQLFNVILGQMSLVGPRPYLARELPEIGSYADILFRAKPGITGFWQVSARNEVTFEERLRMESHYVRNWSIWWDIILLIQTPAVVLNGRGAK